MKATQERWESVLPASSKSGAAARSAAALLLFAVPLFRFLRVALARFDYPFELEWTEGGMLVNAQRLLDQRPLYTAPGLDFIPFMYPPGYHALVAALLRLAGPGYAAARLASIAATLGTAALIAWLARRAGNSRPLALAWSGMWLATYSLSGYFFDLVRVDAIHTFLLVAAIAALLADVRRPRPASLAALVLLAVAAVLVKQNALVYVGALAAGLAICGGWRRAATFAGLSGGVLGLAVVALQHGSEGWFWFYTVTLPGRVGLDWDKVLQVVGSRGVGNLPIGWLALPGLAALARKDGSFDSPAAPGKLLAVLLAAALFSDVGMAGHNWGYLNVHMPLHACLVLVAALSTPALSRALGARAGSAPVWLLVGMAVQVWATSFNLGLQLPDSSAREDSERVARQLASTEGRILAPEFPWLLRQAGKPTCFHISALADLEAAAASGLPIDLSVLPAEARASANAYLKGGLALPRRLRPLFEGQAAQPFGADRPGWPPLDGMHTRPLKLLPRKAPKG